MIKALPWRFGYVHCDKPKLCILNVLRFIANRFILKCKYFSINLAEPMKKIDAVNTRIFPVYSPPFPLDDSDLD